jgi:hypothetical protein
VTKNGAFNSSEILNELIPITLRMFLKLNQESKPRKTKLSKTPTFRKHGSSFENHFCANGT